MWPVVLMLACAPDPKPPSAGTETGYVPPACDPNPAYADQPAPAAVLHGDTYGGELGRTLAVADFVPGGVDEVAFSAPGFTLGSGTMGQLGVWQGEERVSDTVHVQEPEERFGDSLVAVPRNGQLNLWAASFGEERDHWLGRFRAFDPSSGTDLTQRVEITGEPAARGLSDIAWTPELPDQLLLVEAPRWHTEVGGPRMGLADLDALTDGPVEDQVRWWSDLDLPDARNGVSSIWWHTDTPLPTAVFAAPFTTSEADHYITAIPLTTTEAEPREAQRIIGSGHEDGEFGHALEAVRGVADDPDEELLAIGAYLTGDADTRDGRLWLFRAPLPEGDSGTDHAYATLVPEGPGEFFGFSVHAPGDLDGDGFGDLVVGAPGDRYFADLPGRAYIFRGPIDGDLNGTQADLILEGACFGDSFGMAVASGDLDGDDRPDLVVGAPANDALTADGGAVYQFLAADLFPPGQR